jgi:serine/threonine protein kinase
VKLGDFGIAKRVSKNETALKTMIGTPLYLAPEVLHYGIDEDADVDSYTNAVDVWSFGCVAYEMLALKVPFPTPHRDLRAFCAGGPLPVSPLLPRTSNSGIEFLKWLLVSNPGNRPSAKEAMEAEWLWTARQANLPFPIDQMPSNDNHTQTFGKPTNQSSQSSQLPSPFSSKEATSSAATDLSKLQPYTWISQPTVNTYASTIKEKPSSIDQAPRAPDNGPRTAFPVLRPTYAQRSSTNLFFNESSTKTTMSSNDPSRASSFQAQPVSKACNDVDEVVKRDSTLPESCKIIFVLLFVGWQD